jgi:uncharacterized membrane protein
MDSCFGVEGLCRIMKVADVHYDADLCGFYGWWLIMKIM